VIPLFTATLLLSSALVFFVQPMFAKMVLPRLGGTPAVWNTCVVFFQLMLLAGYAYSHVTIRWLGVRRQAVLHLLILAAPLTLIPIMIAPEWQPPATSNPILWLLSVLAVAVGLPFFAVSTTAPLLQRWFADTDHRLAGDPFFLYAASNVGSLGALLAYPVIVEPLLPLQAQSRLWAAGYVLLVLAVGACALALWRAPRAAVPEPVTGDRPITAVSWRTRGMWLAFSFVPSSLMLSMTTYVSTDIAAVPLLWVAPLALYLLTFVIAFARRTFRVFRWLQQLFPVIIIFPAVTMVMRNTPPLAGIPVHYFAFFTAALVCHSRLARLRPGAQHLTEFYLWMSIGGALGGLFNTLVAPVIFVSTAEYPLGLFAACWLSIPPVTAASDTIRKWRPVLLDALVAGVVFGITWGLLKYAESRQSSIEWMAFGRTFAIPFALALACWRRPSRFALVFGAVLMANHVDKAVDSSDVHVERTFFGPHRVSDQNGFRYLSHGTTYHGAQAFDQNLRCEPTTYYARTGPIGQLFTSFVGAGAKNSIGIIGLGTGSMAPYARPGQRWTFFEINPKVIEFSEGRYFTFLTECIRDYTIRLGDARLRLAEAPDGSFDVLVFDAFSSDAIPVHLITLEALEMYMRKLSPHGVLAFHISNRYLDLGPVLGALARRLGLVAHDESDSELPIERQRISKFAARWVILAREVTDFGDLAYDSRWKDVAADSGARVWTDDFTNILETIRWTK
jgi:hypothetical protein